MGFLNDLKKGAKKGVKGVGNGLNNSKNFVVDTSRQIGDGIIDTGKSVGSEVKDMGSAVYHTKDIWDGIAENTVPAVTQPFVDSINEANALVATEPERYTNEDGSLKTDEEISIFDINKNWGIGDDEKYNELQGIYDSVEQDVVDYYKPGLDKQFGNYVRQLNFNLARNGLSGGSVDVDKNNDAQQSYDDGLINIKGKGSAARSQAELGDEGIRLDTVNSVTGGMDRNLAWENAINQMQTSNNNAYTANTAETLGNVFGDAAQAVPTIARYNGYQTPYPQTESPIYFGAPRSGGSGYRGRNS